MPADSNAEAPGSDFDRDQEHLRLLAIFHYVVGGLCIVFSSFFLLHVGMAIAMYLNPAMLPAPPHGAPPPREVWLLLAAVASGAIALGWSVGILTIISGRMLAKRRHRIFSLVMASILCAWIPVGTALGVCTILVLSRRSVRELYATR